MGTHEASRTAVLVCQGRAFAHDRVAIGRFTDPVAARLLRAEELEPVERARDGSAPSDWRSRMNYESMRGNAEVMVPRTITIDDAIREHPSPQVVILGAGLDGRAWRMSELGDSAVFEVDQPASQEDKRDRIGDLQAVAGSVRFVPVDFRTDSLEARLREAGHLEDTPTTWVWEGVVPYLTKPDAVATMLSIDASSAPGSRLIVNYQVPAVAAVIGRWLSRAVLWLTRQPDVFEHEPHRSHWQPGEMNQLLAAHGFTVIRDEDCLTLAGGLGLEIKNRRSLSYGRVAVADRKLSPAARPGES
jgi:methyltransferase (TIGR00027 family)